jgi:hypothetical protein
MPESCAATVTMTSRTAATKTTASTEKTAMRVRFTFRSVIDRMKVAHPRQVKQQECSRLLP